MVIRDDGDGQGVLCIPQSQHAAISGQMARAWVDEAFAKPLPQEEVCLAAERHDNGMDRFDADPKLDSETGLPLSFMRMPLDLWLDSWTRGPETVGNRSPYAGLLVSLHGEYLLDFRRLEDEDDEGRAAAEAWRDGQSRLREHLTERAGYERRLVKSLEPATIERGRKLIEIWDAMSLAVCMPRLPLRLEDVPGAGESGELEMRQALGDAGPTRVEVEPWPFEPSKVPLAAEGRRLTGTYADDRELKAALAAAPRETLSVTLISAP